MCPSLAFRKLVLNITFLKNNFFAMCVMALIQDRGGLRLSNVGTFPSTCSPSFLSRLYSSCGHFLLKNVVGRGFTNINHKIVMFDQEHIGNIVFWEVGFQKGNLSISTGHLEVGLNDM